MKNLSLVLNALLLLAVAVLYYLHFSNNSADTKVIPAIEFETDSLALSVIEDVKKIESNIGYIDVDSLQGSYKLYEELSNKLKAREKKYENELNAKFTVLEQKFIEFQKNAPTMTQFEGQTKQQELLGEEQKLYKMRDDFADKFQNEQIKLNEQLQRKIKDYIKEYNKDKNYKIIIGATRIGNMILYFNEGINISKDVTNGLNTEYEKEKLKKTKK